MLLSEAIRKRINFYLNKNNLSLWDLYKLTGVPKSTLCALMDGTSNLPRQETLLHICEGLGITLREFYNDSLFDDVEQD